MANSAFVQFVESFINVNLKRSFFMRLLIVLVVLLAGGGIGGYFWYESTQKNDVTYLTESPEDRKVRVLISANGVVEPEELINVGAQVSGRVLSFGVDMNGRTVDYGSEVDIGTTLALIDSSLMQAEYKRTKANVEQCKSQIEISEAKLKSAEAQLAQVMSQVEQAKHSSRQAAAQVQRAFADLEQAEAKALLASNDSDRAGQLFKAKAVGLAAYESAVTDATMAVAAVAVANAALIEAKSNASNAVENIKFMDSKIIQAEADIAQAKGEIHLQSANLDAARASHEREQQNVDYCTISSPVRGIVIDRRVNIGQTVVSSMSASSLFLIAKDLRKMQVWVSVNEADIGRIVKDMPVEFTIDAFPDSIFYGNVGKTRLNASLSQNVVTYTVEVQTDNNDLTLLPYLTANVKFVIDEVNAPISVTNAALRWTPKKDLVSPEYLSFVDTDCAKGESIVWMYEKDKLTPKRILTGLSDGIYTEVKSGLTLDDEPIYGMEMVTQTTEKKDGVNNPFMPQVKRRQKRR